MSRKYDLLNCSPTHISIHIGCRLLRFGDKSIGVPEEEITEAVRRLEAKGYLKITPHVGKKASIDKSAMAKAIKIAAQEKSEPISPPVKLEELKKFPWFDEPAEVKPEPVLEVPKPEPVVEVLEPGPIAEESEQIVEEPKVEILPEPELVIESEKPAKSKRRKKRE